MKAQDGYFSCHKIFLLYQYWRLLFSYLQFTFSFLGGTEGTARVPFVTTRASVCKIHRLYRILLGTLVGGRPCYPPPQRRWRSLKNILPTEFYSWFYGSSNVLRSNYSVGRRLKVVPQGIVPIVRGEHYLCQ